MLKDSNIDVVNTGGVNIEVDTWGIVTGKQIGRAHV